MHWTDDKKLVFLGGGDEWGLIDLLIIIETLTLNTAVLYFQYYSVILRLFYKPTFGDGTSFFWPTD